MTWVTVVAGLAPFGAAMAVVAAAWMTVRQKQRNDRRDQLWKRVQWAADLILSAQEAKRVVGMAALVAVIGEMDQLDSSDAALLQSIIDSAASHSPRTADATEEPGREVR